MATNERNIRLRVSAQTDGLTELARVAQQLEKLEQAQAEFARSAGTSGRSLASLEAELRDLDRTAKSLNSLADLHDSFHRQRNAVRAASREFRAARDELARYRTDTDKAAVGAKKYNADLKALQKAMDRASAAKKAARNAVTRYAEDLRRVGVNSADAKRNLEALIATNQRQLDVAASALRGYDQRLQREREIRAEVERRAAAEQAAAQHAARARAEQARALQARQARMEQAVGVFRPHMAEQDRRERQARAAADKAAVDASRRAEQEKTNNLKREIQKRIAALRKEREAGGGAFGRFTRNAAVVDAGAAAARTQRLELARQAEAYSRLGAIERAWHAVTGRTPQLQNASAAATDRAARAANRSAVAAGAAARGHGALAAELRKVAGQGRTTLDFFQRLRGQVLELAATYGSLMTAVTLSQQAIQVSIQRTGIENRLLFANRNDVAQTADDLDFVRRTADRLGQSYNNLATLYSRFAASTSAANVPVDRSRRIFENLSEAFTVLGMTQADVEGSFRAMEQSISKGSVQAEELRGQLGDRLPGAVARFAAALGITVEELNKLLVQGRVSSAAIEFFAEDMAEAAKATLPQATRTLLASLNRLRSAYEDFLVAIIKGGFGDQLAALSRQLAEFFKNEDGEKFAAGISRAFGLVVTAAQELLTNIDLVVEVFRVFAAYLLGRVFAAAMAGVVTAFGALASALPAVKALLFGTGTAATAAAAGVRALTLALGPVAFALGLGATVLFGWHMRAKDAARQAKELADEMRRLAEARGAELAALRGSNQAQLEELATRRKILAEMREEAKLRLENARRADEEARAALREAGRAGAPILVGDLATRSKVSAARKALAELDKEDRKLAKEQEARQKAQNQTLQTLIFDGTQARVDALADARKLEAEINNAANVKLLAENDKFYDAWTGRVLQLKKDIAAADLAGVLLPSELDRLKALADRADALRLSARGVIRPAATQSDGGAARDADRRNREIERLREASLAEQERAQVDALRRLTENEATAADARVRLIELEFAKKIAVQEKYAADAEALGEAALAAQFRRHAAALAGEQKQVVGIEKRETAVASLRAEYLRLDAELQRQIAARDAETRAIGEQERAGRVIPERARQLVFDVNLRYQKQIEASIASIVALLRANRENADLKDWLNIEETLIALEGTRAALAELSPAQQEGVRLAREFTGGLAQSFSAFGAGIADAIKGIGSFGDAFRSAADSFREFLADFLVGIGQAIVQAALFRALFGEDGTGGWLGGVMGGVGKLLVPGRHDGGVVGRSPPSFTRRVPASLFASAPRYHVGGVVGLRPGEVPTILQTGEEVLARNDPRNMVNGGARGAANVQIVNAIDAESVVAAGLQGAAGRQIITNIVQANKAAFRQILAS